MFGYATDETPELMPLTHVLATQLGYKLTEASWGHFRASMFHMPAWCACKLLALPLLVHYLHSPAPSALPPNRPCRCPRRRAQVRKNGTCPWLRPDGKTQVTVEYKKDGGAVVPLRVHTILISTQHNPDVSNEKIKEDLMEHVIKPVVRGWGRAGWGGVEWGGSAVRQCSGAVHCADLQHKREHGRKALFWKGGWLCAETRGDTSVLGCTLRRPRWCASKERMGCNCDKASPSCLPSLPDRCVPPLSFCSQQVPEKYLDDKTIFHLNPSGRFVIGGPHGDAGLTGERHWCGRVKQLPLLPTCPPAACLAAFCQVARSPMPACLPCARLHVLTIQICPAPQAARSSLTPTAAGARTAAAPSLARCVWSTCAAPVLWCCAPSMAAAPSSVQA